MSASLLEVETMTHLLQGSFWSAWCTRADPACPSGSVPEGGAPQPCKAPDSPTTSHEAPHPLLPDRSLAPNLSAIADLVKAGWRVLDLGCGDGALLDYLATAKRCTAAG
jgi:2-polyprenyl-3-methyl-5-hydroxy-6-metoxy-1,4-benzoquinol methylase